MASSPFRPGLYSVLATTHEKECLLASSGSLAVGHVALLQPRLRALDVPVSARFGPASLASSDESSKFRNPISLYHPCPRSPYSLQPLPVRVLVESVAGLRASANATNLLCDLAIEGLHDLGINELQVPPRSATANQVNSMGNMHNVLFVLVRIHGCL